MANLKNILFGITLEALHGDRDRQITGVHFDSRKIKEGFLFVAIRGLTVDGHDFITSAVDQGAGAVLCEALPDKLSDDVTYVRTDDTTRSLGIVAHNFFGNPSRKLHLIGVTGTNGKTTTVTLLHDLFTSLGYKVGLLSTVENKIGDQVIPADYTTPDAVQLNELLTRMVSSGCTHAFMEVSSHALVQGRTAGVIFSGAVFTNISHDHLDYHKTFESYIQAKKVLFDDLSPEAFALVNMDDRRGRVMLQNSKARNFGFSVRAMSDYKARILHNTLQGLELDIDGSAAWFKLLGTFNAYNIICVFGVADLLGEEKEEVLTQLSSLKGARGRFEYVHNSTGVLAFVDYAHTPDALDKVLENIDQLRSNNELLITVIGCGGDRDRGKRPKMAAIAEKYSDKVILTSDNPRTEDPEVILDDMFAGIGKTGQRKVLRIVDRREAIRTACHLVGNNDIVLIAGKGHETYQEVNGVRHHFDDREVVTEILNEN